MSFTSDRPQPAVPEGLLASLAAWDRAVSGRIATRWPPPRWFVRPLSVLSASANHGVLWFALASLPCLRRRPRGAAQWAYVSGGVLAAELVNYAVKLPVQRPRPTPADPKERLLEAPRTSSFPSSHAAMSVAACATVNRLWPGMRRPCLALAATLTASRPYLRVHYVGDVVAGIVVGRLVAAAYTRIVPAPAYPSTAWLTPRGGRALTKAEEAALNTAREEPT